MPPHAIAETEIQCVVLDSITITCKRRHCTLAFLGNVQIPQSVLNIAMHDIPEKGRIGVAYIVRVGEAEYLAAGGPENRGGLGELHGHGEVAGILAHQSLVVGLR